MYFPGEREDDDDEEDEEEDDSTDSTEESDEVVNKPINSWVGKGGLKLICTCTLIWRRRCI